MSKIAEAWEKLERAFDDPWGHGLAGDTVEAIHSAVRDLALAVLDEAEREANEHVSDFLLDKDDLGFADWTLHLEAIREEVNKLGEK